MGAQPLPFPYIYLRYGGCPTHDLLSLLAQPYLPPSSSLVVLGEALLEFRAPPPPPRRRASAGVVFPNLSLLLAGLRRGRRHRAARVLNAEVSLFGSKIEIHRDLNRFEYDSFIRVLATLPSRDLQGYEDALPSLSLLVTP